MNSEHSCKDSVVADWMCRDVEKVLYSFSAMYVLYRSWVPGKVLRHSKFRMKNTIMMTRVSD